MVDEPCPALPASERQCRPLTRIEKPEKQIKCWEEVVRKAPRTDDGVPIITAKFVEEVAKKYRHETHTAGKFTGTYRVVYADPPWKYSDAELVKGYGPANNHYPALALDDICNFSDDKDVAIKDVVQPDAVLFLWVTSPMLEDSFEVVCAWGFKYKTSFVWDKVKHNYGHYNSVRHEFLLVCTRGSCTPDAKKLYDSVQSIERTEHSAKPKEFREIIDTLYTDGRRVEVFGRGKTPGWDIIGNQA